MRTFLLLILFISTFSSFSQNTICLDGFTADWPASATTVTDPAGDGTGIDILSLNIFNDSTNLYLKIELADELNLQENNDLTIFIDIDNNPSTGIPVNIIGADLSYVFGDRKGYFNGTIYHDDIGLISLPTHSSATFEIAIARDKFPDHINPIFPQDSIRIVVKDDSFGGDVLPNTGAVSYTFKNNISTTTVPVALEREDTSLLRIMNYNILFDSPLEPVKQPMFTNILSVANPDIILFNEFFSSSAAAVKAYLDNAVPLNNSSGWYTIKLDQGNITASRFPIKQSWHIHPNYRLTASLIDVQHKFSKDILVVNAHFRCCGANTERQIEANAVAAFFEDAKTAGGNITLPEGTPFMIAGDLNLVGYYQQLKTLLEGDITDTVTFGTAGNPDWDSTFLNDLAPVHSESCVAYTWRDESSSFAPGRLDYMIFTGSVLEPVKSYIFDTERMSSNRLQHYQLNEFDSRASDHLPLVVDFRLRTGVGIINPAAGHYAITAFPNPISENDDLTVHLKSGNRMENITIYDLHGKKVFHQPINTATITVPFTTFSKGIYFVNISGGQGSVVQKIVKL